MTIYLDDKAHQYSSDDLMDQIYYIEFWSKWLTVDQSHKIHMFGIEDPSASELLTDSYK